jgi:aspartyl-tRNA(Asn)/glutamyl-tRNA(Gln) amidotransferase subunit A
MTQFAFSVVGLNSHFGTPGNPWDRARIPGGSSSGAAVSVADDMATAAIGSDTVGSIRVPAALCGIVGFKPTQRTVPLRGAVPLSTTLDSIGPMAHTVADCAEVYAVIAGQAARPLDLDVKGLRLAIPREVVLDDLDAEVASVFGLACSAISKAGATLTMESFPALATVHALNGHGVIQPAEALSWHRELLRRRAQDYDPRIKARIETGQRIQASDYIAMLERRQQLIEAFDQATQHYDALVMPTVAIVAPTFDECANAEDAIRTRLLRNSAPFNFLDRCAISLPVHRPGDAPVGLMLVGRRGGDWALLKVAHAIESLFPSFTSRAEARRSP